MKLEIRNLNKCFKKKQVLKDINLTAESGKCIGILGSNGCGKSTLLSILAGVQKCTEGEFFCDGKDMFRNPRLRSELIGYVPQGTPLIEELSAKDNLLLWYSREELEKELSQGVLQLLGIDEFLRVPVSKMSGGMKKRLSIGCAVSKHPPVLLLDEPSAALDLACKKDIAAYLNEYKKSGGLLLLTTHDSMELELCDQWYIIKDGVLVSYEYDGNTDNLLNNL
ncbi:MAG: ABC transporter ATP-binding protein [Ruminococcus sp.]|nr:ABC transporter ATP-binding protein [Ruminococcus sp.]